MSKGCKRKKVFWIGLNKIIPKNYGESTRRIIVLFCCPYFRFQGDSVDDIVKDFRKDDVNKEEVFYRTTITSQNFTLNTNKIVNGFVLSQNSLVAIQLNQSEELQLLLQTFYDKSFS